MAPILPEPDAFFFEGKYTPKFAYHFRVNIDDQADFSLLVGYLQYKIRQEVEPAGRQAVHRDVARGLDVAAGSLPWTEINGSRQVNLVE